jgi:hypothetical protein
MPRKKKNAGSLDEMPAIAAEPLTAIPDVVSSTKTSHLRVVKEFDLRTAHNAWKERNGIDIDDRW